MEQSKIHFIEEELRIIHIPLRLYSHYLPTILQLLFEGNNGVLGDPNTGYANKHGFLNVSITPLEASVVCEHSLATAIFTPAIKRAFESSSHRSSDYGSLSIETFVAISVEGAGMDAGQRVLEVTSPLAMAGISIFFITTYFSDYILVPVGAKSQVVRALMNRGFTVEKDSDTCINLSSHHRHISSDSEPDSPCTPQITTTNDLQNRALALLERYDIKPKFDEDLHLVQCASRAENPDTFVADELALQHGLTRSLIQRPNFLSVTMTRDQSASLLLEKRLVSNFDMAHASHWENVLLGAKDDFLVPVSLDLSPLDIEASGIICGVAGRLVQGPGVKHPIEMTYLSGAKSGFILLDQMDLNDAINALRFGKLQD